MKKKTTTNHDTTASHPMFSAAVDSSWASFDRVRVRFYIISLNTLILAIAEEDYLIFFTGEGEQRVERSLKKSQVTTERLAQIIGASHNAEALKRELKQRRRQRQRQGRKTIGLMRKNNQSARAFIFWYISLPSSAKQQREMTTLKVLWRTSTDDGEFFNFFLNLDATPINLIPG